MYRIIKTYFFSMIFIMCLFTISWGQVKRIIVSSTEVKSGFIQVDNGKLFYEITGEGDPIIFIHDGLVHCETWNHQFPAWSDSYSLIRYDRRGFGKSPAPASDYSNIDDLLAIMDSLGVTKATLIGLSAGSRLAIDFTLEYPQRVNRLIVCGAVVSGMPFTNHLITRGGRLTNEIISDTTKLYNYWMKEDPYEIYLGNTEARAEMVTLLKSNPNDFAQLTTPYLKQPRRQAINFLNEIKVPTLIITGEFDIPDVHAHSGAISVGITGSERVVVSNAGHRVPMEQPETFKNIVNNFLTEASFFQVLYSSGIEKAVEMYQAERNKDPVITLFSENRMNQLGYQYLFNGKVVEAVQLFKLNIDAYPNSFNVYDSYGEALLLMGDTTEAILNYERSLELNPNNVNAKTILEKLHTIGK